MTNKATPIMDRRLKERLVGATILVALIVAIVPELLSGPKRTSSAPASATLPAPTRTVTVDLATSRALGPQGAEPPGAPPPSVAGSAAASAAAISSLPAGAASSGVATPPARQPKSPAAAAPPLESASSSPTSGARSGASAGTGENGAASRVWAVQLGSFASKANAERLAQQLESSGSAVYVISSGSGPSLRYRVRMGPMADRGAAERAVEKLKAQGHAATIVSPVS